MKNKRIIYWGGNHQTIVPRMGACGDGVEPSGGSGGAGDGQKKTEKPKDGGKFGLVIDALAQLGFELQDAAIGTLATALIGDPAFGVTFQKNRPSTGEKISDLEGQLGDLNAELSSPPPRSAARSSLSEGDLQDAINGIEIDLARLQENPPDSGLDPVAPLQLDSVDDLPQPADFVGQQAIINGELYVWKDPPGTWINFGNQETKFLPTDQDREVPIYENYVATITDVHNQDSISTDKTWSVGATEVEHIGPTQVNLQTKFDTWYVDTPVRQDLYTYMKHGENGSSLIINQIEDREKFNNFPYAINYKLYEPLPDNISKDDLVYICKQMSTPVLETV